MKTSSEEEYVAPGVAEEATISNVNILYPLGQSPLSLRKQTREISYARRKVSAVNKAVSELFHVSTESNDGEEMLTQFKEKFSNVKTANEKYMILTCLPKSWSEQKIMVEFGVSLHVAPTAKLTPREVVLRNPPSRGGGKL